MFLGISCCLVNFIVQYQTRQIVLCWPCSWWICLTESRRRHSKGQRIKSHGPSVLVSSTPICLQFKSHGPSVLVSSTPICLLMKPINISERTWSMIAHIHPSMVCCVGLLPVTRWTWSMIAHIHPSMVCCVGLLPVTRWTWSMIAHIHPSMVCCVGLLPVTRWTWSMIAHIHPSMVCCVGLLPVIRWCWYVLLRTRPPRYLDYCASLVQVLIHNVLIKMTLGDM